MNRRKFFKAIGTTIGCLFFFKTILKPKQKWRIFEKLSHDGYWNEIPMEHLHCKDIFRVKDPNGKLIGEYKAVSEPWPDPFDKDLMKKGHNCNWCIVIDKLT